MAAMKFHEAAASSSSSSSYFSRRGRYDVFLSFRGTDTRKIFTDHLYIALKGVGINVYRDDNELPRGANISKELLAAIQDSGISVIVFSSEYASSSWCLQELVKIMECKNTAQQLVFPIFYHVDPSVIRKQEGTFAKAFVEHEKNYTADELSRWRKALIEAAGLAGFPCTDRLEGEFIKEIVEEIKKHVSIGYLDVAKYPVGLDSHVQKLDSLLHVCSNDISIIGICAMGGIGKTTIATAFYNHLLHSFEYKGFLDVRESSKNGRVHLQNKLLSEILKSNEVGNVRVGITEIRHRLMCTRVLLVLDDVDHSEQLSDLAITREHGWFASGSKIIITTRNEHLLTEIKVDYRYMVNELNDDESLELFSWHAFSRSHPEEGFVGLSKDVIHYCKGMPLALTVLGSSLFERRTSFWEGTLKKLKSIPDPTIQKTLKISFNALDRTEQAIFLDVACFFIGVNKDYAHAILDGCGFFPETGITVLISRCLLTVNEYNKLAMHDLLRDMGREIVCEESRQGSLIKLGNRSRLWLKEDVLKVLRMQPKGTEAVEGLILKLPESNDEHLISTEAFAEMCDLRLLQLNYVHLTGGYDRFSKELRWVCWHGFPLDFIPNNFHVENLVAIDLRYSKIREVWKGIKVLGNLKVLNLSHSRHLTKTPNFSKTPNLEKLKLKDCPSLVEVHPSIGDLHRLVLLDMRDCIHLKNLPLSICLLKTLKILNLSGCSKFEKLPNDLGKMEALIELHIDGTAVIQLPASIVGLKNIKELSLCPGSVSFSLASVCCSLALVFCLRLWSSESLNSFRILPPSLVGLNSLTILRVQYCFLSDEDIPEDLWSLSTLKELDLSGNSFQSLPDGISNLPNLQFLYLAFCRRLQCLPELPTSLRHLMAMNCTSLEILPNFSKFQQIPSLYLSFCHKLVDIPGLEKLNYVAFIHLEACNNLSITFKETILRALPEFPWNKGGIFVCGDKIPDRFHYQSMVPWVSFQVPPAFGYKSTVIEVCAVYAYNNNDDDEDEDDDDDDNDNNNSEALDHTWVGHFGDFVLKGGDEVEVEIDPCNEDELNVKKCGVRLYNSSESVDLDVLKFLMRIVEEKDKKLVERHFESKNSNEMLDAFFQSRSYNRQLFIRHDSTKNESFHCSNQMVTFVKQLKYLYFTVTIRIKSSALQT